MRFLLFAILFHLTGQAAAQSGDAPPRNRFEHDILTETFGFDAATPASVAMEKLIQGCPARDCIPSIDEPAYESADQASRWLGDDALVMAMAHNGDERAWPIRILDFHEIVNDTIGGDPIAITWCPLCGSGVAFDRRIDGKVTEFGVSGVLHDSDLVMYDRASNTLWQQITGEGIMGPRTGEKLAEVPVTLTEWSRWREAHPKTRVLSREQPGFDMDYGESRRYAAYEDSDRLPFPPSRRDLSLHPKTVVFGFSIDGQDLAVLEQSLDAQQNEIDTRLGDLALTVRRLDNGQVIATDEHGRRHDSIRLFWFAWYNFHPGTTRI